MLATPTSIGCSRCQAARSQAVMARVRHVAGRDGSEWMCRDCRAVWVFVTDSATQFVGDRDLLPLPPRVCPCPLGGPLQLARAVRRPAWQRDWLWVCAGCGGGIRWGVWPQSGHAVIAAT